MTTKRATIDPASLSLPAKVIAIAGDVFAWDEATDPPWAGEWAFPPKGWSDGDREKWVTMNGTLIGVTKEHEAVLSEGDALATSPAFLLANIDADISEKKRQKGIDERRIVGAKAWTEARKMYGANVRPIPTVEGDVVIMVGMTAKESDRANAAAKMAADQRLQLDPKAQAEAADEYLSVQRNAMLAKCVHPVGADGDRSRIREIAEAHPGLWDDLFRMRNDMARARVDDEGKGYAP